MNHREIPRLSISKRIDIDDLTSKDFVASPDYCDVCIQYIIRFLQKKRHLHFRINSTYTNKVPTVELENRRY